ncbi:MAG: iron-containing alcohol dehydrogenase [Burkholderiales bacterium]
MQQLSHSGVFVFPSMERIVYGQAAADSARAEAERLSAQRVFLLVSRTMNRTTDEVQKVRTALGARYAGFYDSMPSHTPRDAVIEATQAARSAGADLVITFGGGSVTDGGKMVRLCLEHGIDRVEGLDALRSRTMGAGRKAGAYDGPRIPQISIPTTLSAGDFHAGAGCTDTRRNVKEGYRHPKMMPAVVVLDPAPTVHAPLSVFLSTGIRALDHAVEGFCSGKSNPASDGMFLHAVKLLAGGLPRVKQDPRDLDARLECQLATWLSMAARQAGAPMGASHAIGHVLGGTCGVAHGFTSCLMLPHVMHYNRPVNAALQAHIAEAMGHKGEDAGDVISSFVTALGLPRRLSEVGVTREHFTEIAEHCLHEDWTPLNPRKIESAQQIIEILEAAA